MKNCKNNCILLFLKYPEKGHVKKRLSKDLDATITTELYKNFILDVLSMLISLKIHFTICFDPPDSQEKLTEWLGDEYDYLPQEGKDLGERMKNCFIQTFSRNFNSVIVIGSDSPDIPENFLLDAFSALGSNDMVIGPCSDGGYYLLGFNSSSFLPEAFENINWSTNRVFRQTIDILNKNGRKTHILPEWKDVDIDSDLKALIRRNKGNKFSSSKTFSYLKNVRRFYNENL